MRQKVAARQWSMPGTAVSLLIGLGILALPCLAEAFFIIVSFIHAEIPRVITVGLWYLAIATFLGSAVWFVVLSVTDDSMTGYYFFREIRMLAFVFTRWDKAWRPVCLTFLSLYLLLATSFLSIHRDVQPWNFSDPLGHVRNVNWMPPPVTGQGASPSNGTGAAPITGSPAPTPAAPPPTDPAFEPMPADAPSWPVSAVTMVKLSSEVSVGPLMIRPPLALLIKPPREDVAAGELMLEWDGRDAISPAARQDGFHNAILTIRVIPKTSAQARQRRPVLALGGAPVPDHQKSLLTLLTDQPVQPRYARSHGVAWMVLDIDNIAKNTSSTFAYAETQNIWVAAQWSTQSRGDTAASILDAALASIRMIGNGEPAIDPYTKDALVRMSRTNDEWALQRLKTVHGVNEPKLPEPPREAHAEAGVATVSRPAMIGAENSRASPKAATSDPDSKVPRAVVAAPPRLTPEKGDPYASAVALLGSTDPALWRQGLDVLRRASPEGASQEQRAIIVPALWRLAEEDPKSANETNSIIQLRSIALTLATKWTGKDATERLIQFVRRPGSSAASKALKQQAIMFLGRSRDEKTLPVLMDALRENPVATTSALVDFGPGAEKALLKQLDWESSTFMATMDVLEKIGGRASLAPLNAIIKSPTGTPPTREAAARVHAVISARVGEKPTQPN